MVELKGALQIKEAAVGAAVVFGTVHKAAADGLDWEDAGAALALVGNPKVRAAIEGSSEIPAEGKDLSTEEFAEVGKAFFDELTAQLAPE